MHLWKINEDTELEKKKEGRHCVRFRLCVSDFVRACVISSVRLWLLACMNANMYE